MRALFAALWIARAAATYSWVLGGDDQDCDTVCSGVSKICNAEALALVDSDYFEGYVVPEYCEHLCPDPPPNGASYICSDLDVSTSQTAPYADAAEEGDCYHSSGGGTCAASASGHYRFCPCDDQARRPPRPAARLSLIHN